MTTNKPSRTRQTTIATGAAALFALVALVAQFILGLDLRVFEEGATTLPAATASIPTLVPIPTSASGAGTLKPIEGGYDGGWYQVYFTTPLNTTDAALFVNAPVENAIVAALDGAKQSIDAALYELNSQPVTDALLRAFRRGVTVRVLMDGEYGLEDPEATAPQLELAGIDVRSDGTRNGFMHNKFFVIDEQLVWTGSTNMTHNDIYNNNNNALLVRSSRLAANYSLEFEELFRGSFGSTSSLEVLYPSVTIDGTEIETVFEAEGNAPARVIKLIEQASSVHFLTFSFTRSDIFDALIRRAYSEGLDVQGVVEASSRQFISPLYCAGINVHQDGNSDVLHHKVMIFDEAIVVTGSFNFTNRAANNNDENMLIIHSPQLAQIYLEEYAKLWTESKPIPADAITCG